jgi:hypothetical protein
MQTRKKRQARNEALLRQVNEQIERVDKATQEAGLSEDTTFEFLCECGSAKETDVSCEERVEMTLVEYEEVRSQDDRFALFPGHETAELEAVVRRTDRYVVVDKKPEVEPLVADDPRGAPPS